MKYDNKRRVLISFEGKDLERYQKAAARIPMDFSLWVVAQCERTCKRDARKINNRNNKGE